MEKGLPGLGGNMLTLNRLRKVHLGLEYWGGGQDCAYCEDKFEDDQHEVEDDSAVGDEDDAVEEQTRSFVLEDQELPYRLQ